MINVKDYKHIIHNESPLIIEIFDFINDDENRMFFDTIKHFNFDRARVIGNVNDISLVSAKRTNMSFDLPLFINNFSEIVSNKISKMTNENINKFQDFHVLKYELGEKFSPHHDRFKNNDKRIISSRGQRLSTSILYLNDDYIGGELVFPTLKIKIKPKKNTLIHFAWNDENWKDTMHGSQRILSGTKYAMTCWICENSYGDYDGPKNINSNIEILTIS